MGDHWTVNELAKYLHVNRSTVQRRADRFGNFLSNARSPTGDRLFTAMDVALMAEIHRLAARGRSMDEIEPDLHKIEMSETLDFPELGHDRDLMLQMESKYFTTVELYKQRAETAEEKLREAETRIAYLEGQLSQASKEEVERLNREIGKLQALLEIANQKK